jgi:hypothetical protein
LWQGAQRCELEIVARSVAFSFELHSPQTARQIALNCRIMSENLASRVEEAAGLIAPTNAPPWLATLLRDWVPTLMLDRAVHNAQPTKAKMREQLTQIADAAAILQRALRDSPTKEFLELEGSVRIENIGGLDHTLRVIGERATVAAASPRISATSTMAKRGSGKALPANAFSPKTLCAVIISEVWKYLRGAYPAPRNVKAAAAAEAFWLASGGITRSWGSDPLSSWNYHFKKARSPAANELRQEVRRHCVEHSHSYQMLSQSGK